MILCDSKVTGSVNLFGTQAVITEENNTTKHVGMDLCIKLPFLVFPTFKV